MNGATVLFLPETKGKEIPDTLEDAENYNDLNAPRSDTKMVATFTIENQSQTKNQPSNEN